MGHDEHFLRRLDRVTPPEVELALTLYRDDALVSWILARARVPEGMERIAIALTRDDAPAHVIVARNGRFITCLGRGMSVGDRMVISRARLDALTNEFATIRDRQLELARRHGSLNDLFNRFIHAGAHLSREDFEAVAPFEPVVRPSTISALAIAIKTVDRLKPMVATSLRLRHRRRPEDENLHSFWKLSHAAAHVMVLLASAGLDAAADFSESPAQQKALADLFLIASSPQPLSFAVRGAWALSRVGWPVFKRCETIYTRSDNTQMILQSWGALMIQARRVAWRQDDVLGRFDAHLEVRLPGLLGELHDLRRDLEQVGRQWCTSPDDVRSDVQRRLLAMLRGRHVEPGLETSIARAICANLPTRMQHTNVHSGSYASLASCIPFVADASPGELFLPRRYLDLIVPAWTPDATAALLAPAGPASQAARPVSAAERPGRNDPCPCRSGLKFKRCCANRETPRDLFALAS